MGGLNGVIESDADKLASIVSVFAPILGSVLGSPFAGFAVSLVAKALGMDNQEPVSIIAHLAQNPQSKYQLIDLEKDQQDLLIKLSSQEFNVTVQDKENARQYGYLYKDFMRHMAYLVTIGFFIALFIMCIPLNISSDEKNILSMLVGMLAGKWQTIIDFFFGSSSRYYRQGE